GDEASLMYAVLTVPISPPSVHRPELSDALDAVVRTGLHKDPGKRFATALEMVEALDAAVAPASSRVVARWIQKLAADALEKRADMVAEVENVSHVSVPPEALLTDVTSEISISESAQPLPTIGDHVPVEIEKLGASDVQPVDSERDPKEPDVSRPALNNSVTIVASMSSAPLPDATRSRRRLWVGVGLWAIAWVGLIWFVARRPSTPAPALASTSAAVPATSPVALVEPAQPTASLFQLASASAPRAPSSVMPSVSVAPTTRSPSPPAPSTNRSNRANPPPAKTTPTTPTRQKTSTNRRYTRD
ncbi:MAG: hypothetical protein MUF54_22620, partial [Polyangiaceae bacterium]|nr:hypothetical protein [Polyangiaceae bacterium]